jgi:hypothetical protein
LLTLFISGTDAGLKRLLKTAETLGSHLFVYYAVLPHKLVLLKTVVRDKQDSIFQ